MKFSAVAFCVGILCVNCSFIKTSNYKENNEKLLANNENSIKSTDNTENTNDLIVNNKKENKNNIYDVFKLNNKYKYTTRLKREIIVNDLNNKNSLPNVTSINLEDLLKPNVWGNRSNVTLYGLLNLNNLIKNGSTSSRPKYEITFRILPSMNKIYRDVENEYDKKPVEKTDVHMLNIEKNHQSWTDNTVTPQNLVSNNSSDVNNSSAKNESLEYLIQRFKEMYPVELWKEYGWYTDDYLYIINDHWLRYPPQSKEAHYILAFIYLFVLAAGMFGNLLVIFMFFRCRSLRTPANILVVNLACSDLLMMTELPMLVYNSIFEGPALGELACTIYGFIGGLTGTVSIGTLTAIAFDRYSVVVYPLDPLRAITGLRAKLSVLFTWVYGILFSLIPALNIGLGRYVPEGYLTSCSYDYLSDEEDAKIFIFAFFIAAWVLPLLIIIFCYAKIIHVVIITRNVGKEAAGKMSSRHCKEQEKRKTEVKLAGVVICVIGLFFAAWTPYSVVSLLGIFGYRHLLTPVYSMVPAMCAKLASCLDPFVYVVTHPKFRQECENLFLSKSHNQRKSTMRQGWSENQPNQSVKSVAKEAEYTSENDIEVVEMARVKTTKNVESSVSDQSCKRGIGFSTVSPVKESLKTISSHTLTKGIDASDLPKSLEENEALKPPSWYVKPEFARTNSVKNVVKKIHRLASSDSVST